MKHFVRLVGLLIVVTALVIGLWSGVRKHEPSVPPIRAIWVTRFDYTSPEDVRRIVRNIAEAELTDIFFQVRGNGTAFYRSELEPWAYELSGGELAMLGTDPGWDPLQTAVDAANAEGIRVHAYLNVMPGWKGMEDPPKSSRQLWNEHPDWFMVDSMGDKMLPTQGWYSFLNPVLPEVREHIRGVVRELCGYDVAGIHLDYIRYPFDYYMVAPQRYPDASEEEIRRRADFSYDPESLMQLRAQFGDDVTRDEIIRFRCESITRVVKDISYVMQLERPGNCLLSASVKGNPVEGKLAAYQDSGSWVQDGLVDWAVQMNYGTRSFEHYLKSMKKASGRRGFRSSVVMGLYGKNETEDLFRQIELVEREGCRGIALFSYGLLFEEHQPTEKGRMLLEKLRPRTHR